MVLEGMRSSGSLVPDFGAVTDVGGNFILEGIPAGELSLHVSAPGYNSRIESRVQTGAVEIELTPNAPDAGSTLELVGIGVVLKGRQDALVVGEVLPGGAAATAGLTPGDEVVSIDDTPVVELGFFRAIQKIRGPVGSTVVLHIRKQGQTPPTSVAVERRRIGT